jgi:hypothetical protein
MLLQRPWILKGLIYVGITYPGTKISCYCIIKDNGGSCEEICGGRGDRDERDEEEGEGGLQRGQDCRRQEAGQRVLMTPSLYSNR